MHGRPIRTSLGSEPYGSALVCTGPKRAYIESNCCENELFSLTCHFVSLFLSFTI